MAFGIDSLNTLNNKQLLFLDVESYYSTEIKYDLKAMSMVEYIRDKRFRAFGLAVAGLNGEKPVWISAKDIPQYLALVEEEIGWSNITVVAHNAKFDCFILKEIYEVLPGHFIDTKGMSRAVLGKTIKNHSLATLAAHFGLESKGIMRTDNKIVLTAAEEAELAEYCIHDVELDREIYIRLAKDFPENQYPIIDQTIRMFVDPKLQLNVPLLEKTASEEAKRRKDIFKTIKIDESLLPSAKIYPKPEIKDTSPEAIKKVFASNVKFSELLKKEGYDVPYKDSPKKKDEQGNPIKIPALALGDTDFLEMVEGTDERLKTLCEARIAAKSTLLETRSSKLAKIGFTGRWSFDVEFSGADQTHRFSGGSGAGGNPQNFTRGSALRSSVEAPEGYELVVGDFAQIELRLQAYLSKDPGLIELIENGNDLYCDFGSAFYGRTITKADKEERHFSKIAVLGLGYGMGWEKFIRSVRAETSQVISEEVSKKAVNLYRTRYAQIPVCWEKLNLLIPNLASGNLTSAYGLPIQFRKNEIVLPSGLIIRFPNLRQEQGSYEGKSGGYLEWVYDVWVKNRLEKRKLYGGKLLENICQGLAGELCKDAMDKMGDNVVGQCHDELLVICKKGLGLFTAQKLKRAMSISPRWLPSMVLDAEVHVGANWGECK